MRLLLGEEGYLYPSNKGTDKTLSSQAVYSSSNPSYGWVPDSDDPDVLLGVVSSDVRLAMRAYRDWCGALNLEFVAPEIRVRIIPCTPYDIAMQHSRASTMGHALHRSPYIVLTIYRDA